MPNSIRDLEGRVARLEKIIEQIKTLLANDASEPWWKRTAGMFKGDKVFDQIMREVHKIRRADYDAVCKELDGLAKAERSHKTNSPANRSRRSKRMHRQGTS